MFCFITDFVIFSCKASLILRSLVAFGERKCCHSSFDSFQVLIKQCMSSPLPPAPISLKYMLQLLTTNSIIQRKLCWEFRPIQCRKLIWLAVLNLIYILEAACDKKKYCFLWKLLWIYSSMITLLLQYFFFFSMKVMEYSQHSLKKI